jgi:acylphosphatase
MDSSGNVRLHAVIEGQVQGVGFRYFVHDSAAALGLTGWVRNRWDGSVEVVAEGRREALNHLLAALYRGPRSAVVTDLTPEWLPGSGEFSGFTIRSTTS